MPELRNYGSLREYLEETNPSVLDDLANYSYPYDPAARKRESRLVHQMLLLDDPLVRSPHQYAVNEPVDIVVHMGCHSIRTPHTIDAIMDILDTLGYLAVPLGGFNNCCGIAEAVDGKLETAERIDAARFENVAAFDPDYLITECTSCHVTTATLSMGYHDPDFELVSLLEFLNRHQHELADRVVQTDPVSVALHHHYKPLHRFDARPAEHREPAERLFAGLHGVTVVSPDEAGMVELPCRSPAQRPGTGGESSDTTPAARVWEGAAAVGADVLVTFWHGCDRTLEWYEPEFPATTSNYVTFIGERLGHEYENTGKRYKQWGMAGEIEKIVEHARPVFEANGLPEYLARDIIEREFTP